MLVIILGLPGTGKTTVAEELSQAIGAVVLSTDELRKRTLKELGYTERKKKRVYDEMFRIAGEQLKENKNVILDATFFRKELRKKAFSVAEENDSRPFILEVICDEEIVKSRMEKRTHEEGYSEADYRVYRIIRNKFDPVTEDHLSLDTGTDRKEWKAKLASLSNRFKVMETQEKMIDRLIETSDMRQMQTHISWVLLDGDYAYKIKKPVKFSFVDYSTLEKREHYCHREIRINSMLSPEMYLDVQPIKSRQRQVFIGKGGGRVEDYCVRMKELPQARRLDHLIQENRVTSGDVRKIARIISRFHQKTEPAGPEHGSIEKIKQNFSHVFGVRPIVEKIFKSADKIDRISERVDRFMERNVDLFRSRTEEERIRHCHGDLRTKNIFLWEEKIFIFDAVEFSESISHCDVAAEIAFLAMDLKFFEKNDLADDFVKTYVDLSNDRGLEDLFDFYQCYRALVETLVESYTAVDPEVSDERRAEAEQDCRKYLDLASNFAGRL